MLCWSLHTARLRLSRKSKYCQFFTRFGKCNKDDGKCPYVHDHSKIAVCTKFLNGSCTSVNCKLTHKVIPERMQDCSYYQQGLCSNSTCPYRHVNVNANASICEGFLKGYCDDGNEVLLEPSLEVYFDLTLLPLHLVSRKREGKEVEVERFSLSWLTLLFLPECTR